MKFTIKKLFVVGITLLSVSQFSYATSVSSCETRWNDYGDAPGSYEKNSSGAMDRACHHTNAWQQLGTSDTTLNGDTGGDRSGVDNSGWTENDHNAVAPNPDSGDNGVQWRVVGTNTWGNEALATGQNIEFKFDVLRSDEGNHEFDQLKAWVDWNGNGTFENDRSETLIDTKWYKYSDTVGENQGIGDEQGSKNSDTGIKNSGVTFAEVIVTKQIPYGAAIEDVWLRARIICENSLSHSDRNNNIFLPTGYYHQGEVEDYKLAINVPEPTTLLVFSSALFGLMLSRRKSA